MNIEKRSNRCIGYCLIGLTLLYPLQPAMAAAITAQNSNTQIQHVNDIPVINITKPNQAGISHNQFVDFNVDSKGAVLNNATQAGQSQLAGQINANSNLNGASAKLIINEVVGNGKSQLNGKTEIFGQKADILIANPNGITCDGCGFINTKGVTLTTGTPSFDKNGAIEALTVTKGAIVIGSNGMDVSNVDYTDIISRTAEINGQINAQDLTFIQGTNKIDYATGKVTELTGINDKPIVSVDTKALGGMYANQIHLVSTESGVGINVNNLVSNSGNIILAADGKIQLGNTQANNDLNITGKSVNVINSKKVTSGGNMTIIADAITNNNSQIVASKDMRLYADNIVNTEATIAANNNLWIQKDVNDTRSNSLKNISGIIRTNTGDLVIRADSVENKTEIIVNMQQATKLDYESQPQIIYTLANKIILSVIDASKTLYINSNILWNSAAYIISQREMFLTGGDFINETKYIGNSGLFYSKHLNETKGWGGKTSPVMNDIGYHLEGNQFFASKRFGASIISDHLVADFERDISFINSDSNNYAFFYNSEKKSGLNFYDIRVEENSVLKANNIKMDAYIESMRSLSLIANNNIEFNNSLVSSNELNIAAVNNITLNQSQLSAYTLSLISRNGSIDARTMGGTMFFSPPHDYYTAKMRKEFEVVLGGLYGSDLYIDAGGNILLEDQVIAAGNKLSISAGNDFKIRNTNQLFALSSFPYNIKYQNILGQALGGGYVVNESDSQKNISKEIVSKFNDLFNRTTLTNIRGLATIKSANDVHIDGVKIKTGKEVNIIAGNDAILIPRVLDTELRQKFFPAEKEPELSSVIDSVGNVMISAGRDLYSKAATIQSKGNIDLIVGRDFLLPAVAYTINQPNTVKNLHVVTDINAAKKLTVAVNGDLIANGANFTSGGDMQLSSHGKMEFNSVVNSSETQLGKTKSANTTQQNVVLSSGGNLNLQSDSSILLQATDLDAEKSINAAAKGGFLFAQAMQESSFYETKTTKRKWYGKKKTVIKTTRNVVNQVVDFTANDDITLISSGDSIYQASQINAGKDIKLASTSGKVIFEGVSDTEFNQKIVKSTGFFIKQSDKGYEKETWRLPVINAGGEFTVDAANGITADIIAQKTQSLSNALSLLSNTEGTSWLKDLDKKGDVEWNKVQDAYSSWDYSTQSLNPVIAAVIAVAVAVVTSGAGLAAGGAVAGSVGATGATGAVVTQGVAAGFTALSSKAAISLVENKGNISKTLHDLGSNESIKSIATSMIVGGAMAGFDQAFGISQNANPNANVNAIDPTQKLTLISNGEWGKVAQSVIGRSIIDSSVNTAINGGSFKDRFATALLSNIGNQVNAEAANWIGHGGYITSTTGKLFSHAASSAIAAEIGGGSGKGAAAGAFASGLALVTLGSNFKSNNLESDNYYQTTMLNIGKLTGAVAGAIVARSPEGVYSGSNAGYLVAENNHFGVAIVKAAEARCGGDKLCEQLIINDGIDSYNKTIVEYGTPQVIIIGGVITGIYAPTAIAAANSAIAACSANPALCVNQVSIWAIEMLGADAAPAGIAIGVGGTALSKGLSKAQLEDLTVLMVGKEKGLISVTPEMVNTVLIGKTDKTNIIYNKIDNIIITESKTANQVGKWTSDAIGIPSNIAKNPLNPVQQYDSYGNEIVYRTMSKPQFDKFIETGIMPATTETSVSPVLLYSSKYEGVTVKIVVKPGTFSELEKIGIAANGATAKEFPNMSTKTGEWMATNTRFKVEKGQMTTQLGQGEGIKIFNKNIVHFEKIE
ncbi:DUF637 domain-containing protein [Orbus wheelerorum]|uniref:two-partner secretion domain-containing protein n=1 Tax=Orbus wheelerorum TaxID=3074111 RepID=UPI00370D96A8